MRSRIWLSTLIPGTNAKIFSEKIFLSHRRNVYVVTSNYKHTLQENELITALKQKDETAFKWLVENYQNRLYATVLNLLQNADEAEDALQETFIQVFESVQTFQQGSSLYTWVHTIAVRKCIDRIRRYKTRKALLGWLPGWMPQEKNPSFNHPGVVAENKEKAALLFKALKTLPQNQRVAFTLIKIDGIGYKEVCGIMGMGTKAVESLVGRAKQNLQTKLEHLQNQ